MFKIFVRFSAVLAFALSVAFVAGGVHAMGTERNDTASDSAAAPSPDYGHGMKAVEKGDCDAALPYFQKLTGEHPDFAEGWNMLAYCERKTGELDEAFEHYARALALRPDFAEARQYLGEAHLAVVLEQIRLLKSYGKDSVEPLVKLLDALGAAAKSERVCGGKVTEGESEHGAW